MSYMGYVCLFLASVLLASVSQVLLKKSANIKYNNFLREYLNFYVIVAYGLFFLSSMMSTVAYKRVPLSLGSVLDTTSYLYVTFLSYFILRERISRRKMFGLVLILLGIIVANIF